MERFNPGITPETLIIRATGTLALFMLHVVLFHRPLSRIDKRFSNAALQSSPPGSKYVFGRAHSWHFQHRPVFIPWNVNPFVSFSLQIPLHIIYQFPFQILGFWHCLILLLMAATSHDFWLSTLSPRIWKSLHHAGVRRNMRSWSCT